MTAHDVDQRPDPAPPEPEDERVTGFDARARRQVWRSLGVIGAFAILTASAAWTVSLIVGWQHARGTRVVGTLVDWNGDDNRLAYRWQGRVHHLHASDGVLVESGFDDRADTVDVFVDPTLPTRATLAGDGFSHLSIPSLVVVSLLLTIAFCAGAIAYVGLIFLLAIGVGLVAGSWVGGRILLPDGVTIDELRPRGSTRQPAFQVQLDDHRTIWMKFGGVAGSAVWHRCWPAREMRIEYHHAGLMRAASSSTSFLVGIPRDGDHMLEHVDGRT
jgi:hypothetical protein